MSTFFTVLHECFTIDERVRAGTLGCAASRVAFLFLVVRTISRVGYVSSFRFVSFRFETDVERVTFLLSLSFARTR